MRIEAFGWR